MKKDKYGITMLLFIVTIGELLKCQKKKTKKNTGIEGRRKF